MSREIKEDIPNTIEQNPSFDGIEVENCSGEVIRMEDVQREKEEEEAYRRKIRDLAKQVPSYLGRTRRFRQYSEEEKMIIAAGLATGTPIYRIAQQLQEDRHCLIHFIEKDPILAQLRKDYLETEKEKIEEGIDDCIERRVPAVLMWKAERLLPEKYGSERQLDEEDDSKIVFGDISEDSLKEAAEIVKNASSADPNDAMSAMLEVQKNGVPTALEAERQKEMVLAGAEVSDKPLNETLPTPALKPGNDSRFMPYSKESKPSSPTDYVENSPYIEEDIDISADFV